MIQNITIGQRVKWNDPCINEYGDDAEEQLNKTWEVYDIKTEDGTVTYDDDIVCISDGVSEAEVFASELEMV